MGSSAGTGVAAACLAGGFVIGCAAGYALGQPDRGRAAAAAAGEAAVSLKSSLSGAISDAVQHTRDVGIAAAASEAFECIRSKAKAGFGGSSGGSSGAAHDGGAAGATAAANCSAATPAAPAADGLNGRFLARGAGGESVSVRGEEEEVVAEESEGGEELSASMSGAATPVARNSSGGASTARSTSNAGSGSASSGERLRVAVVVRDDLLPQWGQGKAAAMISSCVVSWYRRCYKARSLRPQLLAWEAQKGTTQHVLRAKDEAALSRLMDGAREAGIAAHAMLGVVLGSAPDEAPSRTRLVVALGPATREALFAAGCAGLPAL